MCGTRTYIFQGFVGPDLSHQFKPYSMTWTEDPDCGKDPRVQDDECVWPVWEDVWENCGSIIGRVLFRVIVVPAHWSEQEMRDSIPWWGEKKPGEVVP